MGAVEVMPSLETRARPTDALTLATHPRASAVGQNLLRGWRPRSELPEWERLLGGQTTATIRTNLRSQGDTSPGGTQNRQWPTAWMPGPGSEAASKPPQSPRPDSGDGDRTTSEPSGCRMRLSDTRYLTINNTHERKAARGPCLRRACRFSRTEVSQPRHL